MLNQYSSLVGFFLSLLDFGKAYKLLLQLGRPIQRLLGQPIRLKCINTNLYRHQRNQWLHELYVQISSDFLERKRILRVVSLHKPDKLIPFPHSPIRLCHISAPHWQLIGSRFYLIPPITLCWRQLIPPRSPKKPVNINGCFFHGVTQSSVKLIINERRIVVCLTVLIVNDKLHLI